MIDERVVDQRQPDITENAGETRVEDRGQFELAFDVIVRLEVGIDVPDMRAQLDVISAQGRCRIERVHLGTARGGRFVLECANGSRTMLVDLDRQGALRRFGSTKGASDTWRDQE